jgi:hypothetical protein
MELEIGFEGKNRSQVYNWDPARAKMHEGGDKNMFEALEPSRNPDNHLVIKWWLGMIDL